MKVRHFSYLAGSIDGDGCVSASKTFQKRSNCFQYDLKLEVTSKKIHTAERLIELFGGIKCKAWVDGVLYWNWICQVRRDQRVLLEGTIPWFVLKKQQAELALDFVNLGNSENPARRKALVEQIQFLNQNPLLSLENIPVPEGKSGCGYLAGLLDTEGTISITRKGKSTAPTLVIYNDSERIMKWLETNFGGAYKLHKQPNHLMWKFKGSNKDRERFLLSVLPYLVTKKEQGKLLLNYVRLFKRQLPEERANMFAEMWKLNHGGTSETQVPDTFAVKTEPELVGDHESELAEMQVS